ncbi:MAG: FAD-binding protein [candidate division Zixibacteria bacterium]|nr:FAD-binding protein [candidate division Zixibacteria bacterium]
MGGPGGNNVVQIDLRRMSRIVEWDEKNRFVVLEPYVCCAQVQAEAMRRGLNLHIIGAGSATSPLASCTSHIGMGWTSISTGFSGRNIMGVEWVLPSGELLRLGTCGSSDKWFCADGPGPSLRGVMRGWAGADGGLGIFTKCAVKLFHWPGPRETEVKGRFMDLDVEVPENFRVVTCIFPDAESFANAACKIGEAEIGFMMCKVAIGLTLAGLTPRYLRRIGSLPNLRAVFEAFKHQFHFVIAGNSKGDFDYQNKTLERIVDENGGIIIDISQIPLAKSIAYWDFVRAFSPPVIFRMGGNFFTAFGGDEAINCTVEQARIGEEIKRRFIAKGAILDDLGDNAWGGIYEHNLFSHTEELTLFDHRDPSHSGQVEDFAAACMNATIEHNLGGGGFAFFAGAHVHETLGPVISNYHVWQRKIKKAFDPDDISDSHYYIHAEQKKDNRK